MVGIRVKVDGQKAIIQGLDRVIADSKKYKEPMERIATHFWGITEKNFNAQGQPKRWSPLTFNYVKWKQKNYPGKKIMQLTGRLKDSLTADNQEDSQDTIKILAPTYMELGTNVEYAAAQHHGYPKRNLPSREIIQVTDKHVAHWNRIVYRWAINNFRKEGFEVTEENSEVVA